MTLDISLKTKEWRKQLEEEIALCSDTTIPLYDEEIHIEEEADAGMNLAKMGGK